MSNRRELPRLARLAGLAFALGCRRNPSGGTNAAGGSSMEPRASEELPAPRPLPPTPITRDPASPVDTRIAAKPAPLPAMRANPLRLRAPSASASAPVPQPGAAPAHHRWDPRAQTLYPVGSESTTWHSSPANRAIAIHQYVAASDWDFAVEVFENKKRIAVIPSADFLQLSPKASHIYVMGSEPDARGDWKRQARIYDVDESLARPIASPCGGDARWSGDRLVQWSLAEEGAAYADTVICVHESTGVTIATLDAKLLSHAGSRWYVSAELGLLPKERDVLWVKERDEVQACTLHMQSLVEPKQRASLHLHVGPRWESCYQTEVDLSTARLSPPKVLFRIHGDDGEWLPWQEAK